MYMKKKLIFWIDYLDFMMWIRHISNTVTYCGRLNLVSGNVSIHVSYTLFLPASNSSLLGLATFLAALSTALYSKGVPSASNEKLPRNILKYVFKVYQILYFHVNNSDLYKKVSIYFVGPLFILCCSSTVH